MIIEKTTSNKLHRARNIHFVLLTWQSERFIDDCLDSLSCLSDNYKISISIFDNGSTDNTIELIEDFRRNNHDSIYVDLIRSDKNIGTTKSRNAALRKISDDTDYICVLDSDTTINCDAVDKLVAALESDDKNMIAAPRMFNAQLIEQRSVKKFPSIKLKFMKAFPSAKLNAKGEAMESYPFMPDPAIDVSFFSDFSRLPVSTDNSVYPVEYAISACWFMRRSILDKIGYLDERIFYAPEDVDYCARVREAGYKVVLASGASIFHYTQRISKRRLISRTNLHHICGLIYYFCKHWRKLR